MVSVLICVATAVVAQSDARSAKQPEAINKATLAKMLQSFNKVEEQQFPWGWIRWLMNDQLDPNAQMTFGIVKVNAGQDNPLHRHPNCEEVLYVLSGSCAHRIGDETVVLKKGDVLRIPQNVPHSAKVLGNEPLQAVIVYNTGNRQFVLAE